MSIHRCSSAPDNQRSIEQWSNDVAVNVGQATIDSIVADGKALVINAQQVQDCCVNVVDLRRMISIKRLVAPFVGWAMRHTCFDAAAAKPIREDIRIMVPAFAALG